MSPAALSSLPVEIFEKVLEYLNIPDILRLKLLGRQAYRVICCSNLIKYRVQLFLAGLEDGNHYSLAERQQFLLSYQSNWDSLTPQKTTTFLIPDHETYELAGGVYGLVPKSSPNSIRFYRLPSVSRRIEMQEWIIQDLDFLVDDFTMDCAYDLLTAFTYKTGHVKTHLLKLSDGGPHPRARKPLLEFEIPLCPTQSGWELEAVIWENRLGCLFTSTFEDESVDSLVVWDWTTGDLVRVFSQSGNRTFVFLNENTIVTGRVMEDVGPCLCLFDLASNDESAGPFLTLAFPDEACEHGLSWRIRLNLGIPIHHGPELRVHVPFVVNPSRQILVIVAFLMDSDDTPSHCIAIPLSVLGDWVRSDASLLEWSDWIRSSVPAPVENPYIATFSMGSRLVTPRMDAIIDAIIDAQPPFTTRTQIPVLVYNLNPYRQMRVAWNPSQPHCEEITGVWNTVTLTQDNGSYCRTAQLLAKPILEAFMTEDSLILIEMGLEDNPEQSLTVLSF